MLRKLIIVGVSAGISASVPILYQSNPHIVADLIESAVGEAPAPDPAQVAAIARLDAPADMTATPLGRKVLVNADGRGHFSADFRMNGRTVTALIDTGATLVAINQTTARRIGIRLQPADFRYRIATANGETKAAAATIGSLQIGRIHLADVQAVVLEDAALSGTLVGMSFLKRLGKYQVENGSLLLVQ